MESANGRLGLHLYLIDDLDCPIYNDIYLMGR